MISIGHKWENKEHAVNVYCGRGSVFGNPYPITETEDRNTVCNKYEIYFNEQVSQDTPLRLEVNKLIQLHANGSNINLQCYCAPKRCHCETIKQCVEMEVHLEGVETQHKLIIAGGRDFDDYELLKEALYSLVEDNWISSEPIIISGMAKGADSLAIDVAEEFELELREYPALWKDMSDPCVIKHNKHGEYNALAGMKRNQQMGEDATHLLAFWDGKSKGTHDMIKFMENSGKPVYVVKY